MVSQGSRPAAAAVAVAAALALPLSAGAAEGHTQHGSNHAPPATPAVPDDDARPGSDQLAPAAPAAPAPVPDEHRGHGAAAEPPAAERPVGVVLGAFAGVNFLVLASAAVVQRRHGRARERHS